MLLGVRSWWVPVLLLVISDLILGILHEGRGFGGYTLLSIFFYTLVAYLGGRFGKTSPRWIVMWSGTLLSGVIFYVVANSYSWAAWPGYEKSVIGWWQSQTVGVPGVSPPAWMFLRNSLIADSIWCGVAWLVWWLARRATAAAPAQLTEH